MNNASAAGYLDLFRFGFTPSGRLSQFLEKGLAEWWVQTYSMPRRRTWVDGVFPTGCIVRGKVGPVGIVHERHDNVLSLLVPSLERGTWSRATVNVEETPLEAVHPAREEATKDELFREALDAIAMRTFVAGPFASDAVDRLSTEQMEFLFLLDDNRWLTFVLGWWYMVKHDFPFLSQAMDEVIVPGLLQRHNTERRHSHLASILLRRFGIRSKRPELIDLSDDPHDSKWTWEYIKALPVEDMRRLWEECDAMWGIQNRFDHDRVIRDSIKRVVQKT